MTNHCFISYSTADAPDFARRLADELEGGEDKFVDAWLDKRDIAPGRDWDDQIVEAIQTCKCMLFVMTPDSVASASVCKKEWNWALKCKKVVVPIRLQPGVEQPFGLGNRHWIDFTDEFEAGLAKLRLFLRKMDSPEGQLQALKDRLADAHRDLHRARKEEDKPRIQADIDHLVDEIKRQEEIVKNPQKAQEQTQKNIEAGLERERQPQSPISNLQSTKFINPPPGIAPNYFQDRFIETEQIVHFLKDDSQRMMTIVGRGGVGKTAMVCRLLKGLESGELPDGLGAMKVEGIVYLSETGSHRVNFANVFADLSKLLPNETAERLEGIYKNPQTPTGDKMRALLDAFPSGRVILLLDNFETLIDPESLSLRDSELSDALNALLGGQHHAVKAVITTRIAPRDLAISEPGRQHHLSLDEGLESPYAENVLREMDADGRVGLKSAPDALLNKAREKTRGYPRALEALYAILSVDRYTTLEELLEIDLPKEVVEKLVGEAFNRLDPSAQKVMQALAVYNRPVSPAAIDYLLQPHLPSIDSALMLHRLVNMHFARRDAGKYYLHSADSEYALSTVPEGFADDKLRTSKGVELLNYYFKTLNKYPDFLKVATKPKSKQAKEAFQEIAKKENINMLQDLAKAMQNLDPALLQKMQDANNFKDEAFLAEINQSLQIPQAWTRYALTHRAADYFAQARKPRTEWKKLDDLAAQLAEFDLRCAAGDYDTAASVLIDFDREYLSLWGHYRLMISLHEKIFASIKDKYFQMHILNGLETAYRMMGDAKKAITYLGQGLNTAKESTNRQAEGAFLGNLGLAYADLGEARKAIEFHEQALAIAREIGDRRGEGNHLGNLGNAYAALGEARKAIEFYEQALVIAHEIGDRRGEGNRLGNLGNCYADLGEARKAIEFYEQALAIAREIGDRSGEGADLGSLGSAYADLGEARKAIEFYEQALVIAREIGDQRSEENNLICLGIGYSNLANYNKSIEYYQQALIIIEEIGDQRNKAYTLAALGSVYFDLENSVFAVKNFKEAIETADEISLPVIQNGSRCGLAQVYIFQNDLTNARTTIEAALQYDVPQNNHNVSALHGIIALRQGDEVTARGAFLRAIGQADEILSKTAEYYSALDAKGLALCGLALCRDDLYGHPLHNTGIGASGIGASGIGASGIGASGIGASPIPTDATEIFRAARKIAPHAGVVKSVLRLFDELAKCDEKNILKDIRAAIEVNVER